MKPSDRLSNAVAAFTCNILAQKMRKKSVRRERKEERKKKEKKRKETNPLWSRSSKGRTFSHFLFRSYIATINSAGPYDSTLMAANTFPLLGSFRYAATPSTVLLTRIIPAAGISTSTAKLRSLLSNQWLV